MFQILTSFILVFLLSSCIENSRVTVDAGVGQTPSVAFNQKSMNFDGVDGVMNVGNAQTLFGAATIQGFAVSFWIKASGTPTAYDGIFGATTDPVGWSGTLGCYWNSATAIYCQAPGQATVATTRFALTNNNVWNHVVFQTSKTGNYEFYINGTLDKSTSAVVNDITVPNADFEIGRIVGDGADLNSWNHAGNLDEIAIWSTVLTAAEVSAIYNGGSPINLGTDSGNYTSSGDLLGYWRMGDIDQSSTNDPDQSGNNNDGTLTGGTTLSNDVP